MNFERTQPKKDDEERILPLINVVFLLLIFFMLAGRLSAGDPFRVDPPASVSSASAEQRDLVVLVGADGQLALDGEVVDQSALKAAVADRASENEGVSPRLRLKADANAQAVQVVAVMELLREAGVERLNLLTVPEAAP